MNNIEPKYKYNSLIYYIYLNFHNNKYYYAQATITSVIITIDAIGIHYSYILNNNNTIIIEDDLYIEEDKAIQICKIKNNE